MSSKFDSPHLVVPSVHTNGTGEERLIDNLNECRVSIRRARDRLQEYTPHGRDYYVQPGDALHYATRDHMARLRMLNRMEIELHEQAEFIRKKETRPLPDESYAVSRDRACKLAELQGSLGMGSMLRLVFVAKLSDDHSARLGWVSAPLFHIDDLLDQGLVEWCTPPEELVRLTPFGRLVVDALLARML